MATLKLRRIAAGHYESRDGRVKIESIHSDEKNAPKHAWRLWLDGEQSWIHWSGTYYATKALAKEVAENYLRACKERREYGNQ